MKYGRSFGMVNISACKHIWKSVISLMLVMMILVCGCGNAKQSETGASDIGAIDRETQPVSESESVSEAITLGSMSEEQAGTYAVNDPDNTRGLDTKGYGFAYGAAKDGKPHQMSVDNQKRFDSMTNVQALALDTKTQEKVLYLTFDCGYEYKDNTLKILDILKEKDVKAAFFCTLPFIEGYGTSVERMILEGHIVGNHSSTHPVFTKISRTKMAEELWGVTKVMRMKYGYNCKYFRFPTGENSENSLELVTSQGYKSVFWSVAHVDWDTANQPSYDKAFSTVTGRLHPGAVILLHSVSDANALILADMIDYARAQGYTFKTLDDYAWGN